MECEQNPIQPEDVLLSGLVILHSLRSRQSSDTLPAEKIVWYILDQLLLIRQGKWLSAQLLNRLLFSHFMSSSHSLTSIEKMYSSRRLLVQFLGNEGIQTVRWLMRYNKPVVEIADSHYIQDYLLEKKSDNKEKTIGYMLYVIDNSSLSTNVGNSGLFCKWLMKLLFWNSTSTAEIKELFNSICQSLLHILKEAPALCLLNYYTQLITDLLNIISFSRDEDSLHILYSIFNQMLDNAIRDQTSSYQVISPIVVDAIHQFIAQFPTLSLSTYPLHSEELAQMICRLPSEYIHPEIQSILNLLENGFSDSTTIQDAIANIHLLNCLCRHCPHRMRYYTKVLVCLGFDGLVYGGKMRESGDVKELQVGCVDYWLVLLEMDPPTIQQYLNGFYNRVNLYHIDRVYDIREDLAAAFQKHIQEDECAACKSYHPLSFSFVC